MKAEINVLHQQMEKQRKEYDARLRELQNRLQKLESSKVTNKAEKLPTAGTDTIEAELQRLSADEITELAPKPGLLPGLERAYQSLNPDISVIIDGFYHNDDTKEGISNILADMDGFGDAHGHDEHGHEHSSIEKGFNLREIELRFSGEVDPYFKAWSTVAVSEEGAELEEAVIQTTSLPAGFQFQAGKFFSDFSRTNAQHPHQWDFVDQPLINNLLLGDHGLNETGVQLSWLAPTPFYLLAGAEAFQGGNEKMFNYLGDDPLPDRDGPRVFVGWLKVGPDLPGNHGLQVGLFGGHGVHQEEHDGDGDDTLDHWLHGDSTFWGGDLVYKYDSPQQYGKGDLTVEAGYLQRRKDLEVRQHDLMPGLAGRDRVDDQDGLHLQAVYGFAPRWRAGFRWDQVGLVNRSRLPDGSTEHFGNSHRLSAMMDVTLTEFSQIRLQLSRGEYFVEGDREDAWEVFLQLLISLGAHGAHKF
ncbi:MAG: hypothetical protein QGF00_31935 [Planctomycetota bacterium]|nr:hypothetical protein [Planctomycetota bacterium]